MISEVSCDTEDCSNDAENSALNTAINYILKCILLEKSNFYYIFDQISLSEQKRLHMFQI